MVLCPHITEEEEEKGGKKKTRWMIVSRTGAH
jgi:hypothetical protein